MADETNAVRSCLCGLAVTELGSAKLSRSGWKCKLFDFILLGGTWWLLESDPSPTDWHSANMSSSFKKHRVKLHITMNNSARER